MDKSLHDFRILRLSMATALKINTPPNTVVKLGNSFKKIAPSTMP